MLEIVGVVSTVATRALENGVVVRVCMARRAHVVRVAMARRERRVLRVIERRSRPGCRVVAALACRWEELLLRRVSRVRRVVVVGLVAANAGDGQGCVIPVDVAVGAYPRRYRMRTGQRERRSVVIKGGIRPHRRVVTQFARGREARRRVGRTRRAGVILLMARIAQRAVQSVVVVDVAVGTLPRRHGVRARQLKTSGGVVKLCISPEHGVVAGFARGREARCNVIHRRGRVVVISLMARYARRAGQVVVVVDVTIGTLPRRGRVRPGQREPCAVVVEGRIQPGRGAVTGIASLGEVRRHVIGIRRALIVLQMARDARRAVQGVVVVDVAVRTLARRHRVQACQRESCAVVVERRIQPGRGAVAGLAGLGEVRCDVIRTGRALEILQVAGDARRAVQGVVIVDVAVRALAWRNGVQACQRKAGGGVVKLPVGPQHRVVTLLARRGKTRVRHRRGGIVVVGLMTADAGRAGNAVVVVDVAVHALPRRHRMAARQRKSRFRVVKRRRLPRGSVVARLAGLREPTLHMVGIRRVLEILQMARHASRRRDVVVVVYVTIRALPWRHGVHARQREVHLRVVETGRLPGGRGVARLARLREPARHVVRIGRALKVLQMARHAGGAVQGVVIVDVAVGALSRRHRMHARQNEPCRGVVKLGIAPLHRVMALFASRREAGVRHRCGRAGEILLVTRETQGAGQVVVVVDVAVDALPRRYRVPAGQLESHRRVVELRIQPVIGGVATLTRGGKLGGDVVWIGGLLEVRRVAGIARRRHRLKLAIGRALMTGVAVDGGVRPGQREPVIVLLDLLDRHLPTANRVALFAVRSQLPLVNVRMAVLAALPDAGEHGLYVTLNAGHRLVHAAQRVSCLIVIEFWNRTDRFPPGSGVTVLTRHVQISVRAVRTRLRTS